MAVMVSTSPLPKIVYMGSPWFAAELLEFIRTEKLAEVKAVWTAPLRLRGHSRSRSHQQELETTPVGKVAARYGLPLRQPEKITEAEIATLQSFAVDFALVIAYGQILPEAFFTSPRLGTFNVHFSLLPRYRGAAPLTAALLNGDDETGISIQRIVKQVDAGPVTLKRAFPIATLTYKNVLKVALQEARLGLTDFLSHWQSLSFTEQDEALACHTHKLRWKQRAFTLEDDVFSFVHKIRAFGEWKGVGFFARKQQYFIETARLVPLAEAQIFKDLMKTNHPGAGFSHEVTEEGEKFPLRKSKACLYAIKKKHLVLFFTGNDPVIELLSLKRAGRPTATASDFINAHHAHFPLVIMPE